MVLGMRKSCFALLLLLVDPAWPTDKAFPHRWVYVSRARRGRFGADF